MLQLLKVRDLAQHSTFPLLVGQLVPVVDLYRQQHSCRLVDSLPYGSVVSSPKMLADFVIADLGEVGSPELRTALCSLLHRLD